MTEAFADRFAEALASVPEEHRDPSRFVGSSGPLSSDVVFVGEAPGAREVEQGVPFVGSAGRTLDSLLADAGIDREAAYVTNLVNYPTLLRSGSTDPLAR